METKENSKKKSKLLIAVITLSLLVVVAGTTYAIWNYAFTGEENLINSQDISIEYLESSDVIDIANALPMSDDQGKVQEETFDFEVTTITGTTMNIGYSLILDKLEVDSGYTPLNDSDINLYLTDGEGNELVTLNVGDITENNVIYSDVNKHSSTANEIVDRYVLRAWIDQDVDASDWNADTKLQYKFRVNVNASGAYRLDKSGANEPVLTGIEEVNAVGSSIVPLADEVVQVTESNMIPVYYDESDGNWKKADETNTIEAYQWYDYDNKMWANTVTVTEGTRSTYQEAALGTTISMNDILTMQVWIPRYKYEVFNYNLNANNPVNPQEIKVTFESGENTTGQIKCTDAISGTGATVSETCVIKETSATCTDDTCNGLTYTHPAFTWGVEELTGLWIGKFENSYDGDACTPVTYDNPNSGCNITTKNVKVVPNVTSWRGSQIGTSYTNIVKMDDPNNMYGFIEEQDNVHMLKSMEWGAVAYLSNSKYGKNAELEMNTNSNYTTGCGPTTSESTTSTTECSSYETELGQGASTTGNIYGVYDMSGGAWDQTMSAIVSTDGTSLMVGNNLATTGTYKYANSGFNGIVYDGGNYTNYTAGAYTLPTDTRHYDKYSYGTTYNDAAAIKRTKLGEGIREVWTGTTDVSWYGDYARVAFSSYPWAYRGGNYGNGTLAGLFASNNSHGTASVLSSSRVVLAVLAS